MINYLKYRLKKDTPNFKAGNIFVIHSDEGSIFPQASDFIYDPRGNYYDSVGNIKHFDEWFEEVKESNPLFGELTHDDRKDRVAVNIWFRKDKGGGHPKKMVDFIQFMEAVNVVSQDDGFMTRSEMGSGWAVCLNYDGGLDIEEIDDKLFNSFYFEWDDDAKSSIAKHPNEWRLIINYKWGKE